ncbi:hypothetical protein SLA2020_277480 [Shorea laevis]
MDFRVVSLDGLMGSETGFSSLASDPETKQKWYGGGFLKQERSSSGTFEDDWRSPKLAKTDDFSASKVMQQLQQRNALLRSNCSLFSDGHQQQQMLSFSSPKSEPLLVEKNSHTHNASLPYFQHPLSAYNRNTGYSSGNLNGGGGMHGVLAGARGPFTPSQWMELEHQALIYKYINANMPVPSNLLIPIRKALDYAGFSSFPGSLLRPNTLGWGSFHMGFSNNDPEPGRCRRTDGKKWRCSRDAVADQKYCERHMNRGRHRSRKPVEGQTGHAITGTTTTTNNNASSTSSKLMPIASSPSGAVVVAPGGGRSAATNSLAHQQLKNLQPGGSNPSAATTISRMLINKENGSETMQDTPSLSMLCPSIDHKPKENSFMIQKQQNPYEESSRNMFGLVTSDSLLNPSHKSSSLMNCSSQELSDRGTESQRSLRHFIDDWPKTQSDRPTISWPELDSQSDRTQLSISIPMASSDFISSTSSTTNEKLTLSPLRLTILNEPNQKQANWIPISWETSMGGPLGEVLHHSSNSVGDCKNSSALNLMTGGGGWDNSPPIGSSPTGVLQRTTFGSLSNSSAGSSPRADNHRTLEGASQCNDLLGSTLVNSSSLPAL